MATPELLPFCQLQYFPIKQPKALVVRGYHVVTNVNLRVNRMAVRVGRKRGNLMEGEALNLSVPSINNTDLTNIVRCAYAAQHSNY
jgi:hypothetical protein